VKFGERVVHNEIQDHIEPGVAYIEVWPQGVKDALILGSLPPMAVRPSMKVPRGLGQSSLLLKTKYIDQVECNLK